MKWFSKFHALIFIVVCISMLLCGCWEHWRNVGTSPGWIAKYYTLGNNSDSRNLGTQVEVTVDKLAITISPDYPNALYASALNDNDADSKYYALCEKYGDIKPGGFLLRLSVSDGTNRLFVDKWKGRDALVEQIDNIEVTADICWDSGHPKGILLNDIFEIRYGTYYPFVQSGWSLDEPLTFVTKPLDELQAGEMKLLCPSLKMYTTKLPELETGSYTLTITLYYDTGKTSSYKFAMSNEPSNRKDSDTCKL